MNRGLCVFCIFVVSIICFLSVIYFFSSFDLKYAVLVIGCAVGIRFLFKRAGKLYDQEIGINKIKKYASETE
jgi:hypothetical protein